MVIGFHKPDEKNGYLSNWYPSRFTVAGGEFSSMEQYMMYQKAVLFHDVKMAEQIMATDDFFGILFNDGQYIYSVEGTISTDELVKIAQNVK